MRVFVIAVLGVLAGSAGAQDESSRQPPTIRIHGVDEGAFAAVDDIRMYFEVHGAGEPLLMIHGGFGSVELWDRQVPTLAQHFRVITMDCRGRARTRDSDAPITYGRMASDIVRLLDYLDIESAHVVGHSDGGIVTLYLLLDFPDRLRSATLIGTPFSHTVLRQGYKEEIRATMDGLRGGQDILGMRARFNRFNDDPSRFRIVVDKLERIWLTQPNLSESMLGTIERPVLVVKADRDNYIPAESFDRLATAIPRSELLFVPGGTHGIPATHAELLSEAIRRFAEKH